MSQPILVGAVVYDPKVVVIWDIIKAFFIDQDCDIDYVFYSNYELQVEALVKGQIDVAWNSPLAWLDSQRRSGGKCRAIAMRDTDRDRLSYIVAHADSELNSVLDLKGRRLGTGAQDSPQATLIPLELLLGSGLKPEEDFDVVRFDVLLGKHGDHIGGEKDALNALKAGEVDASCLLDLNYQAWTADGTLDPNKTKIIATTERFDHCVFTVRDDFDSKLESRWLDVLFRMDYENPEHREMMDMEGLKKWERGRTTGFAALSRATDKLRFFEGR